MMILEYILAMVQDLLVENQLEREIFAPWALKSKIIMH